jgi:hypothetical protein
MARAPRSMIRAWVFSQVELRGLEPLTPCLQIAVISRELRPEQDRCPPVVVDRDVPLVESNHRCSGLGPAHEEPGGWGAGRVAAGRWCASRGCRRGRGRDGRVSSAPGPVRRFPTARRSPTPSRTRQPLGRRPDSDSAGGGGGATASFRSAQGAVKQELQARVNLMRGPRC